MQNSKSETKFQQFCGHPQVYERYQGPMPIGAPACNQCNDAVVVKFGYCCPMIDCDNTCNRRGNPDLCNLARNPGDAFKMDPEVLPLLEPPRTELEDADKWKKEPLTIKNAKQFGTVKTAIVQAERMNKKLAEEGLL